MAKEPRPKRLGTAILPPLLDHGWEELQRRRRAYARGPTGRLLEVVLPPPWVLPPQLLDDDEALAWVVALDLVNGEPWLVRGVLERAPEGPPILGRVCVEAFEDTGGEVTGTVLRWIRLGTIRDLANSALSFEPLVDLRLRGPTGAGVTPERAQRVRAAAEEAARLPLRRGRQGFPHDHYRRIAFRYLELAGETRHVLKALAAEESERLGRTVPRETIRDWVRKATELDYLAPGKRGRATKRPGPNLYRKERQK